MKRLQYLFLVGLTLGAFSSCDQINGPFLEDPNTNGEIIENPTKVIIMDFTGHTCKSCPKAHRSIHMIEQVYKESVIPIAFHLGYFANPQADGKYETDFRTPEGAVLEEYYDFVSFPIGWVNRMGKDDLIPYPSWASETDDVASTQSQIILRLESAYEEIDQIARVNIAVRCNGYSGNDDLKMVTYLLENHIISYQRDEDAVPMDVADYEHNHVYRRAYQNVWGEDINVEGLSERGLDFVRDIQMDDSWVAENCHFVVFIYDPITMKVVQAESVDLIEE